MDLIPRYLQAVRFWLPKKQQDDIIAELSEDIRSQIAEREAGLGRSLSDVDVETLLRERGSPIKVANGYLPQQQLIGPLLFPVYVFVLKVVSLCIVVGCLAGAIAQTAAHGAWAPSHLAGIASHFWIAWFSAMRGICTGWLTAMGVVTIVFAVLERTDAKTKLFESWNPRTLPPLRPFRNIPRSSSVIGIAGTLCVLIWWAAFMGSPFTFRLGSMHLSFISLWTWFFWGILLVILADASLAAVNLLRPYWSPARVAARLCLNLAGSAFFCWFLKANIVAAIEWPGATPEKAAAAVAGVNGWLAQMFPWAVAISILILATDTWRLIRLLRKSAPGAEERTQKSSSAHRHGGQMGVNG